MKDIESQNKKGFRSYWAPVLMVAVLSSATLIYTACYWQPDDKPGATAGTGRLAVQIDMAAPRADLSSAQIRALEEANGQGWLVLALFREDFLSGANGQRNTERIFGASDELPLLKIGPGTQESDIPEDLNDWDREDVINTSFEGLLGSHLEVLEGNRSGTFTFPDLAPGSYVALAIGEAVIQSGVDPVIAIGRIDISADDVRTLPLSMGEILPLYDFLITQYGLSIPPVIHPAGGYVFVSVGESWPSDFSVGGLMRQYLGRVDGGFRHRISIFEPRTQLNSLGHITSTDKSYLQFTVVTQEMLKEDWTEFSEELGSGLSDVRQIDTFGATGEPPRVERLRAYVLPEGEVVGTDVAEMPPPVDEDWDFSVVDVQEEGFLRLADDGYIQATNGEERLVPYMEFDLVVLDAESFVIDGGSCFDDEAVYDPDATQGVICEVSGESEGPGEPALN